jgi:polyisoprenoid-binding protein YceI
MKRVSIITLLATSVILLSFKAVPPSSWSLDKNHGKLGFSITHLMVSEVEGSFKNFDAKITTPNEDFTDATVELTAEATSINTDNEGRDKHLRTPDFFDVASFPMLTFKSSSFKKTGPKTYKVKGDLTMHGVTKPVTLDVVCNIGTDSRTQKPLAGFKITGTVKRSDFAIGAKYPGAMLSDEVTLNANAEFKKE